MQPTTILPPGYRLFRSIDLSKELRLLVILNLIGLALFVIFGALFFRLALMLRPAELAAGTSWSVLHLGVSFVVAFSAVILLHELVHGAFFWLFTRETPRFGLRSGYAFAAAPGWFIPRNQYLAIGLAPLVLLSLAGVVLLAFAPLSWLPGVLIALATNASGAIGDILIVTWLLRLPSSTLVQDFGDAVSIYSA